VLHALGRASAVQIDLVIAVRLPERRAAGKIGRLAAADLQRDRMFSGVEAQVPLDVAVDKRASGYHLGVNHRMRRKLAEKEPAMPVRPIHHWCGAEAVGTRC
jgi:hypothetical protein